MPPAEECSPLQQLFRPASTLSSMWDVRQAGLQAASQRISLKRRPLQLTRQSCTLLNNQVICQVTPA